MKKNKKKNAKSRKKRPKVTCVALVLVDEGPLRKRLQSQLKRSRTFYRKAQVEWEEYQNEVLPAYQKWLAMAEGDMPFRIQAVEAAMRPQLLEVQKATECADYFGYDVAEAFARMKDIEENRALYPQTPESAEDPYLDEEEESDDYAEREEYLRAMLWDDDKLPDFRAYLNDLGYDTRRMKKQKLLALRDEMRKLFTRDFGDKNEAHEPEPAHSSPTSQSLKKKYRVIVKALHPDSNGSVEPHKEALWLEVQKAYQSRDEAFLDVVLAQIRLESDEVQLHSIWDISSAVEFYRNARISLRKTLNREKRDPAWKFRKLNEDQKAVEAKGIRKTLEHELKRMEQDRVKLDELYRDIVAAAKEFDVETFRKEAHEYVERGDALDPFEDEDLFVWEDEEPRRGPAKKGKPRDRDQGFSDFF